MNSCSNPNNFPFPWIPKAPCMYLTFLKSLILKKVNTQFFFCKIIVYLFIFNLILFLNFTILYWFCHISKWIHHRHTCVPHPEPSSLPIPSLWVVPVHQPQASSIVHRIWTGDSFHIWYYTYFNAILPNQPTLSLSHRVIYPECINGQHACFRHYAVWSAR